MEQGVRRDFQILMGWGDAIEANTAYFGCRPLLQAFFGLVPGEEEKSSLRKIFANTKDDPYVKARLPLLTGILPLNIADNEITSQMTGEVRKDKYLM